MPVLELDYAPYDYQAELHLTEARFAVVVGGRRVGKSKMALQELLKHCLETPHAVAWWVSPTITMAREVGWEEFLLYKDILTPAIAKVNDTLLRVRFTNGSVLYFKGGDNEKSLRGRGLSLVVVDEAAFLDEEIWTRALLPALADKKGRAILISTPNGRNWFYKLALDAQNDPEGNWRYWHWPSYMNPLMDEVEMQNMAAAISENDFRQEFLGEFITRGGMVYDDFGEENIINSGTVSPHDFDVYLGMDFGFANPTAVAFLGVSHDGSTVFLFDEIYAVRTKIEDILAQIVKKLAYHGITPQDVKAIYTDPAGNAEELSSGVSPVDFLRMCEHRFKVINRKSLISPGVALVRSFIKNAGGQRRFFVTKNCYDSIRSLYGYTYDKREGSEVVKEEPLKDGIHDHMCDAIRYFFVNRFDNAKWVANTPEQFHYSGTTKGPKMHMKRCAGSCKKMFPSHTPKGVPPHICKECSQYEL